MGHGREIRLLHRPAVRHIQRLDRLLSVSEGDGKPEPGQLLRLEPQGFAHPLGVAVDDGHELGQGKVLRRVPAVGPEALHLGGQASLRRELRRRDRNGLSVVVHAVYAAELLLDEVVM